MVFSSLFLTSGRQTPKFIGSSSIFGGPQALALAEAGLNQAALADTFSIDDLPIASESGEVSGFVFTESAAVLNSNNPILGLPGRDGLLVYKIQKGDTLSKIAANFGISMNTVIWANSGVASGLLRPGQEIVILPISGVIHEIVEGETIDSIAGFYGVPKEKIIQDNSRLKNSGAAPSLSPGGKIIIPDGRPKRRLAFAAVESLPDLKGYFTPPTTGWNWGELHPTNAVDIANACGTPVYAAAEGLVIDVGSPSNWNSGNGGFVEIEHPNKTHTRYSHTQANFVQVGDYVVKGAKIATMGNTGNVIGSSGCHLHFEVRGAKNPLAK